MKKIITFLLVVFMSMTFLTACKQDDGVKMVGFVTPYASNGFLAMLASGLEKSFVDAGYEWNIGVADFDVNKQIQQIENMITLEVDVLVVMAVDPTSLKDVLTTAKDKGVKVINFTTNTGVGDIFVGSDEKLIGQTVAELTSSWIDTRFADATNGSVEVAILEFNGTPEAVNRSLGLRDIEKNSKVKIAVTQEVKNTRIDAQSAIENILLTYPNVKAVLTYNTGMALGVNDYALSQGAPIADLSAFGVFGSDNDPEVIAAIQASKENGSVLRGATQLGGPLEEVYALLVGFADKLIAGEDVPAEDIAVVYKIDPSNADSYVRK
ncbi:MAG: sugar ABC transporter substrate-binding protein [Erysipelotrichaceae bacterium]|nr:sugar ABC transporter substrate-binding protein [Erysipelotrichaceae bacterium]